MGFNPNDPLCAQVWFWEYIAAIPDLNGGVLECIVCHTLMFMVAIPGSNAMGLMAATKPCEHMPGPVQNQNQQIIGGMTLREV